MLGQLSKPKKTDEEITKELSKKRDELIARAAKMDRLINAQDTGWVDFVSLVENYINACKKRKAFTALDTADEKTLQQLKYLDHEIFILSWMLNIPKQVMKQLQEMEKQNGEKES